MSGEIPCPLRLRQMPEMCGADPPKTGHFG